MSASVSTPTHSIASPTLLALNGGHESLGWTSVDRVVDASFGGAWLAGRLPLGFLPMCASPRCPPKPTPPLLPSSVSTAWMTLAPKIDRSSSSALSRRMSTHMSGSRPEMDAASAAEEASPSGRGAGISSPISLRAAVISSMPSSSTASPSSSPPSSSGVCFCFCFCFFFFFFFDAGGGVVSLTGSGSSSFSSDSSSSSSSSSSSPPSKAKALSGAGVSSSLDSSDESEPPPNALSAAASSGSPCMRRIALADAMAGGSTRRRDLPSPDGISILTPAQH